MIENRFTVGDDGNLALKQDTATYTQRQQTAQDNTPTGGPREVLSFPESEDAIYDGRIRFVVHEAVPLNVSAVNALKKVQDKSEEFTTRAAQRIATASIRQAAGLDEPTTQSSQIQSLRAQGDGRLADALEAQQQKENSQALADSITVGQTEGGNVFEGVKYNLSATAPIVSMYFPISLTFNDGVQYENVNLGAVGATALAGLQANDTLLASAATAIGEAFGSAFDFITGSAGEEAARLGALRVAKLPVGEGIRSAVSIGVQRVINPNTRALFRGVNIREFSFNFKMIATSQSEANKIQKIVKHFRTELYPDVVNMGNIPVGYKFPNAFSIQFTHRGQNVKIPKIEKCFLRNVQTVYNGTSATFHDDGHPNEVDMTLSFVEMKTINKQDVRNGM